MNTPSMLIGLMLIGCGALVIFAMYKNWDFMFESTEPGDRKFNALVEVLGRNTVRILFSLLGLALAALGSLGVLGIVELVKPQA